MKLKPRVLILDDDISLRRSLRDMLKRDGFEARIARSVPHLVKQLETRDFDAAVLDVRMTPG